MPELRDAVLNASLDLWGWPVALYLFLGGLAAGLLTFAGWAQVSGRRRELHAAVRAATLLAPPIIAAGLFVLWLDLGSKWTPFWLYVTFRVRSPMSWGAWILLLVLLTSVLAAIPTLHTQLRREPGRRCRLARLVVWIGPRLRALAWANLGLGTALGLYTGVLLGTMVARPALNSPILPLLFLASGLSGAAALLLMLAPAGSAGRLLVRTEAATEGLELGLLGLYLIGLATSTAAGQAAAALLTQGAFAWTFWMLVVVLGLLVPLGVAVAHLRGYRAPRRAAILSGSLVLAGGLALRLVLVYAGQRGL